MPLTIKIELSDRDVDHFLSLAERTRDAVRDSDLGAQDIARAAGELIGKAADKDLPDYIAERFEKLETLVEMVKDPEWRLAEEDLQRVINAMAYFADPKDMIPDRIPGIGFLDDAIMVELVVDNLNNEIRAYREFCEFRTAEEERRRNQGLDLSVDREDWLADQRAVLHHRMRNNRLELTRSPLRHIRLW